MNSFLEHALDGPRLMRFFRTAQGLFIGLALLALVLSLLAARRDRTAAGRSPIARNSLFALFALLLLGVYAYQATWQLAGFARPPFVEFMRRFNRRPENPVARIARGRLLDRNGVVLAGNDPDRPECRVYPFSNTACQVVGYLHPAFGLSGLERADSGFLYGATLDTWNQRSRFTDNLLNSRHRVTGNDRTLTLDIRWQQEAVSRLGDRAGAVVALDPRNGDILVLASTPGFDPNRVTAELFAATDADSPLLNRALHGLYPPGSTFKPVLAAAAIEAAFTGALDCPGYGFVPERGMPPIRDHEFGEALRNGMAWAGHGSLSLADALRLSSNVYFAKLAVLLGPRRLGQLFDRLAMDKPITVFEGSSGAMASTPCRYTPPREAGPGELAQMAIGQGRLLVTPLQMAVFTAAIAHDGLALQPRLDALAPRRALRYYIRKAAAAELAGLLREAVRNGTGRGADVEGLDVAGKTGTAQNPRGADHAWFVCLAPADQPRLVLAVVVENAGAGSTAAVPVAAGLLRLARKTGWFEK